MNSAVTVPIWEKHNLNVQEASEYFNIGVKKISEISRPPESICLLWVGNKRLIKRVKFQQYLEQVYSV